MKWDGIDLWVGWGIEHLYGANNNLQLTKSSGRPGDKCVQIPIVSSHLRKSIYRVSIVKAYVFFSEIMSSQETGEMAVKYNEPLCQDSTWTDLVFRVRWHSHLMRRAARLQELVWSGKLDSSSENDLSGHLVPECSKLLLPNPLPPLHLCQHPVVHNYHHGDHDGGDDDDQW